MASTFTPSNKFTAVELIKLTKIEIIDLLMRSRERLMEANLKLAMARITIAENQQSIASKRKALQRNAKLVRSLRDTVKRRRKHG